MWRPKLWFSQFKIVKFHLRVLGGGLGGGLGGQSQNAIRWIPKR